MKSRPLRVLPGFGLSLGVTVTALSLFVIIPLATLVARGMGMNWESFSNAALSPRALATYRLTFTAALVAGILNSLIGVLLAWTLIRYSFPGRRLLDGIVDLPFALPTAVAGISLTTLYAPHGWLGSLLGGLGLKVAFTPSGIMMAMLFVGIPFVVRAVQPVLEDFDRALEEAAASLGAGPLTTFRKITLPTLLPAILTGFSLSLARGLGEYGSVIFIAGNMPFKTEVTSLLIVAQLEEFDYQGATAIALVMLAGSFTLLLGLNALQRLTISRREAK
ncbi:MAG: sulfate ABC transporter permease subunit CysT [bacterium]